MSDNSASAKAQDDIVVEKKGGKSTQMSEPSLNMDEIEALAALVDAHGLTDFEFENENIRVRLSKMTAAPVYQAAAPVAVQASSAPVSATAVPAESKPAVDEDAGLHKITSPIVGTFYRSAGPDKEPYVKEGSKVSGDTTVCIVEAMKLMNEIQAEISGEVVKIYVENGQPVEYGQALFGIRK